MTSGPVQVLVLGFAEPDPDGSLLAGSLDELRTALARPDRAEVVRLVDVLVVRRAADGSLETVDDVPQARGPLAAAVLGGDGRDVDRAGDDGERSASWSLADVVPERGPAVVALIEHLWAGPLSAALTAAGATLLEESWLSADDRALLASLESRSPA